MLKKFIKNFVEQRPLLWRLAWKTLHSSHIFLPHDHTYYALPHFVKNQNSLILDIGANQGISALSFRRLCNKNPIVSFEPNRALEIDLLKISKRISNYQFHMCGLGDREGSFKLFVPKYKDVYLHTFSSLDLNSLEKAVNETYKSTVSSQVVIDTFICDIKTLDSFGYCPTVIKVDAEGFEAKIFAGGTTTLTKYKPTIIFEAVHGTLIEILDRLHDLDYTIVKYIPAQDAFQRFYKNECVLSVSKSH
jgi:FkbM family methyltransferase